MFERLQTKLRIEHFVNIRVDSGVDANASPFIIVLTLFNSSRLRNETM